MTDSITRPSYLTRGEPARLIPVVADTSRENRLTSVFLAVLPKIPDLSTSLFASLGLRIGKRTQIEAFTEVVFKNTASSK